MKTSPFLATVLAFVLLAPPAEAAIGWTDTITSGTTPVKATHMNQARTQIQNNRDDIDDLLSGSIGTWITGAGSDLYYNSGDVGIGITNPSDKLHVVGEIKASSQIQAGLGSGGVGLTVNDGYGNANVTFNHFEGSAEQTGNAGRIEVNTDSLTNATMDFELKDNLASGVATGLNSIMRLQSDGNVGIGTTSPGTKLSVKGSGTDQIVLGLTGGGVSTGVGFSDANTTYTPSVASFGDDLTFWSNGNERVRILVNGNVGIGTTSPTQALDVVGSVDVSGNLNVGAQASQSANEAADISQSFSGDGNYYQINSNSTTSGTATAGRYTYGGNFAVTNNRGGASSPAYSYGYGVRGYVSNSGTAAKSYYGAGGTFEGRNSSTNGMTNARGVVGIARQYDDDGGSMVNTTYGVEGQALGRSSTATNAGDINVATGVTGGTYPYHSNIATARGTYGLVQTNNSYGGNITTAQGVVGTVSHDSDDGSTMGTAYGGYFSTYKRATAANIGTAYGVYASALGGNTNYGVYSANGKNYFADNIGVRTTNPQASLHINDIDDASLTSTNHAATFGQHTSTNIAVDNNEIMARSNGAESVLHINADGGDVTIHNNQAGGTQFIVKDNGKVGVGTMSPGSYLTIASNADISSATDTAAALTLGSGTTQLVMDGNEMQSHNGTAAIGYALNPFGGGIGVGGFPSGGLTLDVTGKVGATEYCDSAGANCVVAGALGAGDNLGNHTATTTLNVNDRDINNVRELELKDYDDNTGGADNKYRILARDGAHQFYNGGVVVGNYSDGTWTDLADGYLVVEGRVGIGKTAAAYPLDVVGDARVTGTLAVGAQGTMASTRAMDIRENFSGDSNYHQLYSSGTISNSTLTANRSSYGAEFVLKNKRGTTTNGSRGYGYGVRSYVYNDAADQKTYYNNAGNFESRNYATSGISNLRGVVGQAFQNATSGTTDAAYAVEGFTRGRSTAGATSVITNARGTYGTIYPYNSNITNGYGSYGYVATNNSYSGNITTAMGARGTVNHDSDDGGTMSAAYGGYFNVYKRATAPNIGTTYGVYASGAGGGTNYGVYSAAGKNYFNGNVGIGTTNPTELLTLTGGAISIGAKFYVGEHSNVDNGPDIRIVQRGLIATDNDLYLNIDSTNTTTDSKFQIKKNALTTAGTNLFTVREDGSVDATGDVKIAGAMNLYSTNSVASGPDIEFASAGILAAEDDLHIMFDSNNSATGKSIYFSHNDRDTSADAILMEIQEDGNVGIGTTSPTSKLEVAGNLELSGGNNLISTPDGFLDVRPGGASGYGIVLRQDGDTGDFANIEVMETYVGFGKNTSGAHLVIEDGGFVGVGTTNPSQSLHTTGNIRADGRYMYFGAAQTLYGDNSSILYYDSNHSTVTNLQLRDKENLRYGSVYGSGDGANFGLLDGDGNWGILMVKDNYTRFSINNTERMRLAGNSLGIGTTSPADKLEVTGNIRATSNAPKFRLKETDGTANQNFQIAMVAGELRIETQNDAFSSSSAKMTIENNGFVGIGYTNPTDRLHVNGNIKASGQVRAATYCDANGANCANNPFGNQISVNGVEDIYGAFSTGTVADTCNGDTANAYGCAASENQNCTDSISGTTYYACGKDNQNTCSTTVNSKRTVDCQHLQVYGNLTP